MTSLLIAFMMPYALLGAFIIVKVLILPKKAPADTTNRIAHLRLVWWAINKPHEFVTLYSWLTRDEKDNLKD